MPPLIPSMHMNLFYMSGKMHPLMHMNLFYTSGGMHPLMHNNLFYNSNIFFYLVSFALSHLLHVVCNPLLLVPRLIVLVFVYFFWKMRCYVHLGIFHFCQPPPTTQKHLHALSKPICANALEGDY